MSKARDSDKSDRVAADAATPTQAPAELVVDTAAVAAVDAPVSPCEPAAAPAASADVKPPAPSPAQDDPTAAHDGTRARPLIVGIGASAGGLEAFEQLLRAMPTDSGHAFVLVQHLDPTHPSLLTEILQRATAMAVTEACDKAAVLPNHVYVIPPNRDMVILLGRLRLHPPQ